MSLTTITKSDQYNFEDSFPKINAVLPVFEGTDGNATQIIAQSASLRRGAIFTTTAYSNVTIWYSFAGGDNLSAPILFGDDGLGILDWDIGMLMQYDYEKTQAENDGSAYYNHTFFMTSNFVSFYARYGDFENEYRVPHIITVDPRVLSTVIPDIYTQLNDIKFNVTMHKYNITGYGLSYREVTPDHDAEFQNVTVSFVHENENYRTEEVSISHSFEAGTLVEVRGFILQNDNQTLTNRVLQENRAHLVEIQDTTPEVELTGDHYVSSLNYSLIYDASAPYSNITLVEIDWDDLSAIQSLVNVSFDEVYHLYGDVGEYNISVTVYSETLSITEYFVVLIEQEAPSGIVKVMVDGNLVQPALGETIDIEVETKSVTFQVSANDTGGSGVWKISLETEEGNLVEVAGDSGEITLLFLKFGEHDILMTIYDNSDNTYTFTFSVNLIQVDMRTDNPVPFPFGLTAIAGLVLLAVIYLKKKK
jgi:hypothetical protein